MQTERPWLSLGESRDLLWPTSQKGLERRLACRDYFTIEPLLDAAWRVEWREGLLRKRWEHPAQPFETERGGWLPLGASLSNGSQTAVDIAYRQECRASGRFDEADLVRRVIEGGGVEVCDYPDGTLWVFGKGVVWD